MKRLIGLLVVCCLALSAGPAFALKTGLAIKAPDGREILVYSDAKALVVGASTYDNYPPRPSAVPESADVATALRLKGFSVQRLENPTSAELRAALKELALLHGAAADRALVFYYAGHAMTFTNKDGSLSSYLIPRDCPGKLADPANFDRLAISLEEIKSLAAEARASQFMLFFDTNLSASILKTVPAKPEVLTEKSASPVRQFIIAGEPGDSLPADSAFQKYVIQGLFGAADINGDGFVIGSEMAKYVRVKVSIETDGTQIPHFAMLEDSRFAGGDFIVSARKLPVDKDDLPEIDKEKLDKWLGGDDEARQADLGSQSSSAAARPAGSDIPPTPSAAASGASAAQTAAQAAGAAASVASTAAGAAAVAAAPSAVGAASATTAAVGVAATAVEAATKVAAAAAVRLLSADEKPSAELDAERQRLDEEKAKLEQERLKLEQEKDLIAQQKAKVSEASEPQTAKTAELDQLEKDRLAVEAQKKELQELQAKLEAQQALLRQQADLLKQAKAQTGPAAPPSAKLDMPEPVVQLRDLEKVYSRNPEIQAAESSVRSLFKHTRKKHPDLVKDRFIDVGDGTVADKVTGLLWQKDYSEKGKKQTPDEYAARINAERLGGLDGWRLPTTEEMLFLYLAVEEGQQIPVKIPEVDVGLWTGDPTRFENIDEAGKSKVFVWKKDGLFGTSLEARGPYDDGRSYISHHTKLVRVIRTMAKPE